MSAVANPTQVRVELVGTFILNNVYVSCYNKALKLIETKPELTLEEAYASYIQSYYRFITTSDGYRTHLNSLLEFLKKYSSATQVMYKNYRDVNHDIRGILAPKQIKLDALKEEKLVRKFLLAATKEFIGYILSTRLYVEIVANYEKKLLAKKTGMKCKSALIAFMNSTREQIFQSYINSDSGNKITKRNLIIAVDKLKRYSDNCELIIRKKHNELERYKKLLQDAFVKIEHYKNQAQYRPSTHAVELPPAMPPTYGMTGADISAPRHPYPAVPQDDVRSVHSVKSAKSSKTIVLEDPTSDHLEHTDTPFDENRSISSVESDNDSGDPTSDDELMPTAEEMHINDDILSSADIGDGMSLLGDKWTNDAKRIEFAARQKLDEL